MAEPTATISAPLKKRVKQAATAVVAASRAERVSEADMAELAETVAAVERAQQRAAEAQAALTKAVGIAEYVGLKVRQRHAMGPQDRVMPDGAIVRGGEE